MMKDTPKYTLDELLAGMKEGDIPIDKEWDLMPAMGRECCDETSYLLSNPANTAHLARSIQQSQKGMAQVRDLLPD
jgi:hypothetical protein